MSELWFQSFGFRTLVSELFVSELWFRNFSFRPLVSELLLQNFGFKTSVSELAVGEPQTTGWGNPPPAGTFYEQLPGGPR